MWKRENLGTFPWRTMHCEEVKQTKEASREAISALWECAALRDGWMHSSHLHTWIPLHYSSLSIKVEEFGI